MELSGRYDAALAYASKLHRDQTRKGSGIPYLTHLMAVAGLVLEAGGSEDEAIAGLLHDALEDRVSRRVRTRVLFAAPLPYGLSLRPCRTEDRS